MTRINSIIFFLVFGSLILAGCQKFLVKNFYPTTHPLAIKLKNKVICDKVTHKISENVRIWKMWDEKLTNSVKNRKLNCGVNTKREIIISEILKEESSTRICNAINFRNWNKRKYIYKNYKPKLSKGSIFLNKKDLIIETNRRSVDCNVLALEAKIEAKIKDKIETEKDKIEAEDWLSKNISERSDNFVCKQANDNNHPYKNIYLKELKERGLNCEVKKNKALKKPKKKQPPKSRGGSGSGFFISKLGHIITNEHVVKKCNKITVGDNIDRQVPARLIEVDRKNDLALLRTTTLDLASSETKSLIKKLSTQKLGIEIVPLATAGLMRSDDVELGEQIVVAGFPYGDIFSKDIKVTFGNVNSTKGVGDDSSQFQIQAPVQIGNSGGPIYDKYGNIVGVVVAQLDKLKMAKTIGSLPENVNFGIKASTVKQFLNSSGLPTKWAERNKKMSDKDISQIASKQTVMVVCHR